MALTTEAAEIGRLDSSHRRITILITVPWGARMGGAESFLWTFLRHLDLQRFQPVVVFLQAGAFERDVAELGIETAVIPAGRLRNPVALIRTVRELATLLKVYHPHLIINWSPKTHLYGAVAALRARMVDRVIWWQHGVSIGQWMDRLATILPTRAVGSCSLVAKQAQESIRPYRETVVVYPGIEEPTRTSDRDLARLRQRAAIPPGRLVIGTVGRLQPGKGQDHFLRVVRTLRTAGRNVHGLVVGGDAYELSPNYKGALHRLAGELGIEDSVTFAGQVPSAAPYMQLMDIYVSPSLGESFGMVLVEAMALRVPVVAFASGGPQEIIEDGRSGFLVSLGDDRALVAAIERLLADPELRLQLAQSGYQRFRERFSAERMTREMERLFRQLCLN